MKDPMRIIKVVPYNPSWPEKYKAEAETIKDILSYEIVNSYHIGSTSIPGIYAKPIIDILIEVNDIEKIDDYNKELEQLGYIPKGEFGIIGRRFFMKGLYDRTHHIHIFQTGNPELNRLLNFRDYLIAHPTEAKLYEDLKKELAIKFVNDIEEYSKGKDAFIRDIDLKAEKWVITRKYK